MVDVRAPNSEVVAGFARSCLAFQQSGNLVLKVSLPSIDTAPAALRPYR
jgi:hypothetical protein